MVQWECNITRCRGVVRGELGGVGLEVVRLGIVKVGVEVGVEVKEEGVV